MLPVARPVVCDVIQAGQLPGLMRFEPPAPAAIPFHGLPSLVPDAALHRFGRGRAASIAWPYFSEAGSKLGRNWAKFCRPSYAPLPDQGVIDCPVVGFLSEFAMKLPCEFG